jgi:hypothetical protein
MLNLLRCRQDFGERAGFKLALNRYETVQKAFSVIVFVRKPDVLPPMLPKPSFIVNESANLLKQLPCARSEKVLLAFFESSRSAADIKLSIENPIDLRIAFRAQYKMLLIVIRTDGVNELTDAAVLGVVGVHTIFLGAGLDRILNNPAWQSTLSNLGDEMPMRFVMRTIGATGR